jgi:hypothetical protein
VPTETPVSVRTTRTWLALRAGGAVVLVALAAAVLPSERGVGAVAPTLPPVGQGVDRGAEPERASVPFAEAVARVRACANDCGGILYLWSERMPLSLDAIPAVEAAAGKLGIALTLVETEEANRSAASLGVDDAARAVADAVLASGALAHAPALVVHRDGRVVGPAILGYKRAETYEALVAERLAPSLAVVDASARTAPGAIAGRAAERADTVGRVRADYAAVGAPGAYFRNVPGRRTLAYETGRRIWLLDLGDGENRTAPGYIDFVPTPDGRYFVTPGPGDGGLQLYDAGEVFDAALGRGSRAVVPFFVDREMRDQYPSIGILDSNETRTVYRILTSWFEGVVYRDYEVRAGARGGAAAARPLGPVVVPCRGMTLSIPILSQDGHELAARDDRAGTTKIFTLTERGGCTLAQDLGVTTTKVAWHRGGRALAFARPRGRAGPAGDAAGVFVFDRDAGSLERVRGSEGASALAFPDFVGDDAVAFIVPGPSGSLDVFRVVEGVR